MELKEMIYKRKSTRSYTDVPVETEILQKIQAFAGSLASLYPEIRGKMEIVDGKNVRCILPWKTKQVLALFAEKKEGAAENVGFLYQQMDLYLQSLGLGSCWLGMGRLGGEEETVLPASEGMEFVIMIAFGYPKGELYRENTASFKRKALREISDREDERLEPARLAPSSVNSQPWYFVHDGDTVRAYCVRSGLLKKGAPNAMNRVDMGIALAHLYVANPETFRFFREENVPEVKNYAYTGSFVL